MRPLPRATTLAALALTFLLTGCSREEAREERSPIARVTLPPAPMRSPREEDKVARAGGTKGEPAAAATRAVAAPTKPAAAATEAAAERVPPAAAVPSSPEAQGAASPVPAHASPAASPEPAPSPEPAQPLRAGIVGKGVDLRAEPSLTGRLRGTFEGRTAVEVVAEKGEWSLVRAPVITGGFIEGWVLSASVRPPGEVETAQVRRGAPAAARKPSAPKPAADPKPDAPGDAVAVKRPSAPAAAPRPAAGGGKGPNNILLKPIAGTDGQKPAVPFTHKDHYDKHRVECLSCHHKVKARGNVEAATKRCTDAGCHTADKCNDQVVPRKNAACPFFEDAYHTNCISCHREQSGPTRCKECHTG